MKFTRLRLSGFKSFVEPTELYVEPGLTAVVGPNGCGKSNLFDALRWVMGETRPTSVRGSEMDDVIFAGSAGRPARNVAEVTLYVDNADRNASPQFNDSDTIEISRRIEREAGSVYRINGRDVRQRDVQIFFADASSGAGSTAFVRQGQIGMLISQKPLNRRAILEEAAGIGGLHQRRHEAELRLRAAETNMGRLDDVVREIEGQLQSLKRQARQAARYRNLSGLIRKAEALALYLRWSAAEAHAKVAKEALDTAISQVETATQLAAIASTAQAELASHLPPLREAEAEKSAALHRLIVERDALDAEEARAREAAQRLRQRLTQAEQDIARERTLDADARNSLQALGEERTQLEDVSSHATSELTDAEQKANEIVAALAETERTLDRLTRELAEWNARKASTERSRNVAAALAQSSTDQLNTAQSRLEQAMANAAAAPDVKAAEDNVLEAQNTSEAARNALTAAREALAKTDAIEKETRAPLEIAERDVQRVSAETKALADLLRPRGKDLWPPLVDAVRVQSGYESAFAAALGDDLEAPLDEAAPHFWRDLGPLSVASPLPDGAAALKNFVEAPSALSRLLDTTGVVVPEQGTELQRALHPGQRLVSQRGDLWRWDGYAASAEAESPGAIRLAQRNRLVELEAELETVKAKRADLFEVYTAARDAGVAARAAANAAEQEERRGAQGLIGAQRAAADAARAAAERTSRLANLEAEVRRLTETRDAAQDSAKQAGEALAELGDGIALTESMATARGETADARAKAAEARAHVESLRRDAQTRRQRLAAIEDESTRWQKRSENAARQMEELGRRLEEMAAELQTLDAIPATIIEKRTALLDAISTAETARNEAADQRTKSEALLHEADRAAKAADAANSAAREERARAQALFESSGERIEELKTRIRDEAEATPEELPERAEIREGEDLPPQDQADKRVEKLKHEREQLGGVNLRAEEEAAEHETRLNTLVADRADLEGAIDRLRRGIQSLNKEGRERLLESFEKVNTNFQMLFTKLFEGGEAKLTFTESDDPLQAGLEILARPPGKRLQSLSLLSGGEQALTAMSLIFAVFLVNPAPVCVLDEVDAPLDDANVERFCNLLDEMTKLADTRFLVITHHALTMSRMNRIFGVTMAERGVSQLVSVNLGEAEQIAAE
ncbi:MAG TPA: chromosome segregation protein SMC [Rhizomicrobium sp.]|nr:chromosome segregation protein SMC [Rhizomicrobium sp.]